MICVNSVSVYPKSIVLKKGEWYYYAYAEVCPPGADCESVTWHSDNTSVATVNPTTGYIYAKAKGTASIYASICGGSHCCDYITVTVKDTVSVDCITLDYSCVSIEKGGSVTLSAMVYPTNATNKTLSWSSSNPCVATVNGGVVCGLCQGTATITATAADGSGKSARCTVSVTEDILVTSIELTPSDKTLKVGSSFFPSVTVCPTNATNKSVTWSSANSNIASVNPNSGLVYAKAVGTTTIYATACDGSGVCGCCTITVIDKILVSSITVTPKTKKLNVNASATLSATVLPDNADDKRIRWSCEPSGIVSLNDVTGAIKGICAGTTTVKAVACDGSGTYGSCKVTVVTVPVTGVSINPSSYKMTVGDSVRFSATLYPSNATNKSVIWSSSNPSIATVTSGGCVTANNIGDTTISVETIDGGKIDYCNLSVCAVDMREKVTIEKDDEGGYKFFKATFQNGLIWKSVGVERTVFDTNNIAYNTHFRRANSNATREYDDEQLAFLYRLDPLGVEYYVNNHTINMNLTQTLYYKDRIYKAIFGNAEDTMGHFKFKVINGNVIYGNYSGDRTNYYTNAEILFGSHLIPDWSQFWHDIASMVFEMIPGVSALQLGAEIFRGLFFSSSLVGTANQAASYFLQKYCDDYMSSTNDSLHLLLFGWPRVLCEKLLKLTNIFVDTITPENINDITIYEEINRQSNYRLEFNGVSMTEIIDRCC